MKTSSFFLPRDFREKDGKLLPLLPSAFEYRAKLSLTGGGKCSFFLPALPAVRSPLRARSEDGSSTNREEPTEDANQMHFSISQRTFLLRAAFKGQV